MTQIFISYSHKDEYFRNELEKHLSLLKRKGKISIWHDRRIGAGQNIDSSISENLTNSSIILLLISPDFIASDYCYDLEMKEAMRMQATSESIVIPVILRYCNWHSAPFGKLKAIPNDGHPIKAWADHDEAFLQVAKEIESQLPKTTSISESTMLKPAIQTPVHDSVRNMKGHAVRSSNLGVKRKFTDKDSDDFIDDTFEYVAEFFQTSLDELCKRHTEIESKYSRQSPTEFTARIYHHGKKSSELKVFSGGSFGRGICYSSNIDSGKNTMNGGFSVITHIDQMFFEAQMVWLDSGQNRKLNAENVAEHMWAELLNPLQWS